MLNTMAEMVASEKIAPDAILNSKLIAYETEIQSLTADKMMLDQDLQDAKEKMEKIKHELELNMQTIDSMKNENAVLKSSLKKTDSKLQEAEQLKNSLMDGKKGWQDEQAALRQSEEEYRITSMRLADEIKTLKTSCAKDIGRLKNSHQKDLEQMQQARAKAEHVFQTQNINLKAEITAMNDEHKDVVTSQATRLRNYEHQISILETRCNRLQMSLELSVKPKVTDINMGNQLKEMEQERQTYMAKIEDLQNKMSRAKITQHYDFRAKSLF